MNYAVIISTHKEGKSLLPHGWGLSRKTLNSNYDRVFTSFRPIQKKSNSTTFPMRKYSGLVGLHKVRA